MIDRVLFLDIDGVLNSFNWWQRRPNRFKSQRARALNEIDPAAVKRLNRIVERTCATVVLSSAWRVIYSVKMVQSILKTRGFCYELAGATPILHAARGFEIQAWLDSSGGADRIAILDDDSDMAHLRSRLVKTDMERGLTDVHVRHAVKLLGGGRGS